MHNSNYEVFWLSKGGQEKLGLYKLRSLKVLLPVLEKQQEIVDFLDVQFKTLEHIRKLKKEVFTDGEEENLQRRRPDKEKE